MMEASATFQFPATVPTDPSDVALAIETAGALWRQGDSREALRWLRRAAESAETEGDDMRALSLARAAADLKDLLPATPSLAPSAPSAPPVAPSVAPPASTRVRPASAPLSAPVARPSAPPPQPASQRAAVPPAPTLTATLSAELGVDATKLEAWSPPGARTSQPPPVPAAAAPVEAAPASARPAPVSARPVPAPAVAQAPAVVAAPAAVQAAPAAAEPATPLDVSAAAAPQPRAVRAALRVAVEVLSKGSGSLLVRVLAEGERAEGNAHEALLVPLEVGVDLTGRH